MIERGPRAPGADHGRRRLLQGLSAAAAAALAWRAGAREAEAAPSQLETDPLAVHLGVENSAPATTTITAVALGNTAVTAFIGRYQGLGGELSGRIGDAGNNTAVSAITSTTNGGALKADSVSGVAVTATSHSSLALFAGSDTSHGVKIDAPNGIALNVNGLSTFFGRATFDSQVQAAQFKGSGHLLASLNASNLGLGTIPDERQSTNVALKDKPNNTFKGQVIARVFAGAPRTGGAPAFAQAGTTTIPKGQDRVSVTTAALKRGVSVVATLQSSAGRGIAIECVERQTGGFDIVLTAPAKARTQVAYFLFRQG